jgi:hypothetical protein
MFGKDEDLFLWQVGRQPLRFRLAVLTELVLST